MNRGILYFSAPWCGPCKVMSPLIEQMDKQGKIKVKKINVDYDASMPQKYNIKSVPTMVLTDLDGNEYYEVDYLTQDVIYKAVKNTGSDSNTVPYILKQFQTFRRFTTEFDIDGNCTIQFGGGSEADFVENNFIDFVYYIYRS